MKKLLALLVYLLISVLFILFFLPKVNLYYKAEELLHTKSIVIAQERIEDSGFSFSLYDGKLYYGDLYVANFSAIHLRPFILYNALSVEAFTLSEDMQQFLPLEIEGITISYTPFNPLHVNLFAKGEFGELTGDVSLKEQKVNIDINASKMLRKQQPFWLRKLKKVEGKYHYELKY